LHTYDPAFRNKFAVMRHKSEKRLTHIVADTNNAKPVLCTIAAVKQVNPPNGDTPSLSTKPLFDPYFTRNQSRILEINFDIDSLFEKMLDALRLNLT
jgi:hypothetical protein